MTDWPVKTLGEVCDLISRGRPPSYCDEDGALVLNQKCVRNGEIHFGPARRTDDGQKPIPEWAYLQVGDTLINSTGAGTLGRASFVSQLDEPTTFDTHLTVVRPLTDICWPAYVGLVLNSRERDIVDLAGGATGQTELPREAVRSFGIPVPPLEEQKRIVELLEAVTTRVTELNGCYEQARALANDLFTSALREVLESNPDWPVKSLGDISEIAYGYTESAKSEEVGPKFLRITDIKDRGVDWNEVPFCPIDTEQLKRHRLEDGDIVFARTGATTGKSFLVTDPPLAVCASYLIRLRIDKKMVSPEFLNLNFQTTGYWKQVNDGMSGAAQGGFNATKLGALEIPVPQLGEQTKIVAQLDSIRAKTLEMVAAYDAKLAAAKNLRHSILEAAFAGDL